MIKLSISPCPNDTFMFDGWVNKRVESSIDVECSYYDIEELNQRVIAGEPDISKISSAILPLIGDEYELLDCGSALGRGNGPLLVRRKGDTSPIRRVAVPGLHTTACALMRRLHPEVESLDAMLFSHIAEAVERGEYNAGVLIHEGRFVYQNRNLELVSDLGLEWEQRFSLPLPLGSIVVRRSLGKEVKQAAERTLRNSIEFAFQHPQLSRAYVKSRSQELDDSVIDSHISLFVNDFSLSLGTEGRRAIEQLTGIML